MVNYADKKLDVIFSALSDPTRRNILERLRTGEASITQIAEPFNISLPAISKHVSVLEKAGLVSNIKAGRTHYLRLNPAPMKEALAWLEYYSQFWQAQFDSLATFLETPDEEKKGSND